MYTASHGYVLPLIVDCHGGQVSERLDRLDLVVREAPIPPEVHEHDADLATRELQRQRDARFDPLGMRETGGPELAVFIDALDDSQSALGDGVDDGVRQRLFVSKLLRLP